MQQVRYFVALADTLNFTRAAERCNVSQPALTRAVQLLEQEFGGPLFHRERSNTHLSELGRAMLPYFQAVEEQCRAAREQAIALRRLEQANLTIGIMGTVGPHPISELLVRFQEKHPKVELKVVDTEPLLARSMLEKGELEIAVISSAQGFPDSLHLLPIFEERFVVVLPPNHRFCARSAIRGADLDKEPYVGRANCDGLAPLMSELEQRGIFPRQVFSSTRDEWVIGMIKAGLGIGFLPEHAVTDPDLVIGPLVEPDITRTVYLTTVRGRPYSPAVKAFVQEARNFLLAVHPHAHAVSSQADAWQDVA